MSSDFGEDATCFSVTRINILKETISAWSFFGTAGSLTDRSVWPLQQLFKSVGDYLLSLDRMKSFAIRMRVNTPSNCCFFFEKMLLTITKWRVVKEVLNCRNESLTVPWFLMLFNLSLLFVGAHLRIGGVGRVPWAEVKRR